MRIIHGHDYYDSVLAYGQDTDLTFVREKSRTLDLAQAQQVPGLQGDHGSLLFTGKKRVYNTAWNGVTLEYDNMAWVKCIRVYVAHRTWCGWKVQIGSSVTCYWSLDSLAKWAHNENFSVKPVNKYWYHARDQEVPDLGEQTTPPQLQSWMIQNRATIITYEESADPGCDIWRINGDNLRDLQMFKVVDAFSMFQTISEWVGGVLPKNGNPMVEITDDKIKAHKHGFDKHSFRKLPTK